VEHSVGQATHLRVAALAGVSAEGVGQGSYLLERPEYRALD
jgi:hypothetical protein